MLKSKIKVIIHKSPGAIRDFFFDIIKMKKIAIQGIEGSFHDIAARKYFDGTRYEVLAYTSFPQLFDALEEDEADCAVVAIENTIAGSILPNYALLKTSGMKITGETYLRIEQHLLIFPGQKTEEITEIHSHPMALQQCMEFLNPFRRKGVKLVDTEDTALSAKNLAAGRFKNIAVIASRRAARLYGLEIAFEGIETNKQNYTRFLIVSKTDGHQKEETDKASLCFVLPHKKGSLSAVLSVFSFYDINLTKIQSLPIPGRQWEYLFHVDLTFDETTRYHQAVNAIRPLTTQLDILGEYKEGGKQ